MTPFVTHMGEGSERVLAIHCTLAHSGTWNGVARALKGAAQVTAFDLPSHGKSPDWPLDVDQHRFATDWGLHVLDEPMHIVGHSFGATVAMRMAIEAPEKVLSLTLFEPVYLAAARRDEPERFQAHADELAEHDELMLRDDREEAASAFNRIWGDGTRWSDFPRSVRQYMTDRIHFVRGSSPFVIEDNAKLLDSDAFSRLTMPVVLVRGERALDVIKATNEALARRIPNVRQQVIKDAGHMAPITHPVALANIVTEQIEAAKV